MDVSPKVYRSPLRGVVDTLGSITKKKKKNYAYSNILKILPPKDENFQIKSSDIFHSSAQNKDCGYSLEPPRRGGSNEYLQSIFLRINKENNVHACKPQFYYTKVGFKGVKIILVCFHDGERTFVTPSLSSCTKSPF